MRWLTRLYTAAALCATPALALDPGARAAVEAARAGDMTRLTVHETPRAPLATPMTDAAGSEHGLSDYAGRVVLVNFWATWCPPCLKEMPSLDRLAAEAAGEDFAVVAISTDRGSPEKPAKWLAQNGVTRLDAFYDGRMRLAREAALLGQPTTLLLDRQGREVARFQGDAAWDGPEARAVIAALIAATDG